jgi:hypothetical protein
MTRVLRNAASLAALVGAVVGAGRASAVPIVDLVLIDQSAGQATVRVDLTMPDAGLIGYSFSASFSGTLSFAYGQNLPPPGMDAPGAFDDGGAGPGIITLIHGVTSPPFDPVGVGAQTFTVAELTFDLNGAGGLVETGLFYVGVDGFAGPDGHLLDGQFDEQQLAEIQFGSLQVHPVPEPETGLLAAAGLVALGYWRYWRNQRRENARCWRSTT